MNLGATGPAYLSRPEEPLEAMTIGDLLRARAVASPAIVALKEIGPDGEIGRSWTYAELLADAERFGRALANRHRPGARLAVYANNIPEWILLEIGSALAGTVLVTANPAWQASELHYVLDQSRAEALYCVDEFRGNPMRAIADKVCADLPAIRRPIDLRDHAALFEGEESGTLPPVRRGDIAPIQFTSGTTGQPKGALLHHRGLVRNACDIMERAGLGAGDVFLHIMPMFHTTGCAMCVLGAIGAGATMLLPPLFDPALVARIVDQERPALLLAVPTMLVALLGEHSSGGYDFSSLTRIVSGGDTVPPELIRRVTAAFGAVVQLVYGQTECSPGITMSCPDDPPDSLATVGRPLPNVEVAIRGPQSRETLAVGEEGEICTRGYHVMAGYDGDPAATAEAIDGDGWLRTGDLGFLDPRGFLTITGRIKDMIIRGSENLYPAEIELAMLEHPDVSEVAVVGVPCPIYGEQAVCFMRPSGERRPDAAELKAFIRQRLSPQKTPAHWLWVDRWPLTGSGKIQKFRLAEQFESGAFASQSSSSS
jgi:fatty-acyl-CoA synthase